MATKLPKWKKALTAKQRAHLREMGITSLAKLKDEALHQDTLRFPCWECVAVCRDVGITVMLSAFHDRAEAK